MNDTAQRTSLNKPLLIALAAVLVVAMVFFLVINPRLAADPGADELPVAATQTTPPTPAAADPQATEEAAGPTAPEAFEIYSVRDPFEQLVQVAPAGSATEAPTAAASATPTAQEAAGDDTTAAASTTVDPGATAAGEAIATVTSVALQDVSDAAGTLTAQVVVDGTSYQVTEGQVVTGPLQLLALAEPCGTFQLGTTQFTLCEGQSVTP